MNKKIGVLIASIFILCCIWAFNAYGRFQKEIENEIALYCNFSVSEENGVTKEQKTVYEFCTLLMLKAKNERLINTQAKHKADVLNEFNIRYSSVASSLMDDFNVNLPYSTAELVDTLENNYSLIASVINYYNEQNYGSAFQSLTRHKSRYTAGVLIDLIVYLCPNVFTKGIPSCIAEIGNDGHYVKEEERLKPIRDYVESMPEGIKPYQSDFKQVEARIGALKTKNKSGTSVPYEGMPESEINYTSLGKYTTVEYCRDYSKLDWRHRSVEYKWYTDGIIDLKHFRCSVTVHFDEHYNGYVFSVYLR